MVGYRFYGRLSTACIMPCTKFLRKFKKFEFYLRAGILKIELRFFNFCSKVRLKCFVIKCLRHKGYKVDLVTNIKVVVIYASQSTSYFIVNCNKYLR